MKRFMAWLLSAVLILSLVGAYAEEPSFSFDHLSQLEWSFSSGAGAWSTDIRFNPDGTFSGEFHDSEMGDAADAYPDGTIYLCTFTGRMTLIEPLDEYSWRVRVDELEPDEQEAETIADGVRYVKAEPYGLSVGDEMRLYRPGTPVHLLSEEMRMWTHVQDMEDPPLELQDWFLCSEANDSGFLSWEPLEPAGIANPWLDMTADELFAVSGLSFAVPEGAENVLFRYLPSESLAEMQFTLQGCEYCARVQPADPQDGPTLNISGMYFAWDREEPVRIGHCDGTHCFARTGSTERVELCQWYDAAPGLAYAVSVYATDDSTTDLLAMAEQVFFPAQGDI